MILLIIKNNKKWFYLFIIYILTNNIIILANINLSNVVPTTTGGVSFNTANAAGNVVDTTGAFNLR